MPSIHPILRRLLRPLSSRKVRVAIATAIGAVAAEAGFDVSDEVLLAITGIGASLILGIAHEDAGRNAASPPPSPGGAESAAG